MSKEINSDRRRFFGTAAMTLAAAQFGIFASASADASNAMQSGVATMKSGTHTSFDPLKQIDAGVLNV